MTATNALIRNLREEKGLTSNYLAAYLSIAHSTYSAYETGSEKIPLEILVRLAKFYSISLENLIG